MNKLEDLLANYAEASAKCPSLTPERFLEAQEGLPDDLREELRSACEVSFLLRQTSLDTGNPSMPADFWQKFWDQLQREDPDAPIPADFTRTSTKPSAQASSDDPATSSEQPNVSFPQPSDTSLDARDVAMLLNIGWPSREVHNLPLERWRRWLLLAVKTPEFESRLSYLDVEPPTFNTYPLFEEALAYALCSNTLASDEFLSFVATLRYDYWGGEQDWADIVQTTNRIWTLPDKTQRTIAFQWYHHILRNLNVDFDDDEDATLLQKITGGKVKFISISSFERVDGVSFNGPYTTTIVTSLSDPFGNDTAALLLAKHLHAQLDRDPNRLRFCMYCLPGDAANDTPIHRQPNLEIKSSQQCLLSPLPSDDNLTPAGTKILAALLQLGVPKMVVRTLFFTRNLLGIAPINLLRKPKGWLRKTILSKVSPPNLQPGQLVVTERQHVYFIDDGGKRQELHNDTLIALCAWNVFDTRGAKFLKLPEEELLALSDPDLPIRNVTEAFGRGVCGIRPNKESTTEQPVATV
jgi:hypothetical protein